MSADAADAAADADADADAAAERRLNHSIPRTYFVRGIQLSDAHMSLDTKLVGYTHVYMLSSQLFSQVGKLYLSVRKYDQITQWSNHTRNDTSP